MCIAKEQACRAKLLVRTERCALLTTNVLIVRIGAVICHRYAASSAAAAAAAAYTNEERVTKE